jgi:mannose-6-phosphate isomerase-like protein (cupin superfamily)
MSLPFAREMRNLQTGVADVWKSFDVATVNENAVRFRVMENTTANWHVHEHSDELFYVVSGIVLMDTELGVRKIQSRQLFVVPAGTRHRARVEGRATLLVVDNIPTMGNRYHACNLLIAAASPQVQERRQSAAIAYAEVARHDR